jgi:phosphoglycolate phosphatase-like HAD superfamily hydrolase
LMVGDYLFDLLCAKSAGAVAVLLTNNEQADEFAKHADFCIETIDQIPEIIKKSEDRSKIG